MPTTWRRWCHCSHGANLGLERKRQDLGCAARWLCRDGRFPSFLGARPSWSSCALAIELLLAHWPGWLVDGGEPGRSRQRTTTRWRRGQGRGFSWEEDELSGEDKLSGDDELSGDDGSQVAKILLETITMSSSRSAVPSKDTVQRYLFMP